MECSKFGPVVHIYVEKESQDGHLYIKFGNVQASETAFRNLDGRFFAAKKLSAAFIPDAIYNARFPNST